MSFFSLTPHPSVSPIVFSFSSTLSSFHLPSDVYLPVRLCGFFFFSGSIESSHSTCMHTNTQTHLYELLHVSLSHHPRSLFLSLSFTHTHTHMHTTHSHQTQADGPSARQAADPCPHSPNEHPLALGGQTQNQTPNTANTTVPTATHYQPPACCDIPCALIVQHSYEPTNPSELAPKMRMTTFTTSPPTPRLYIQ